ncbi:hypothetical protein BaRGS_00029632 [Batillaria attramentaria]|uniref:Uncharacterized protein n=1 Tax=Batillaria attramentaria TaxID=370345 RepID=A0ABD0JWM3_9CAEN
MATPIADDSAEKTSGDSFADNKVTGKDDRGSTTNSSTSSAAVTSTRDTTPPSAYDTSSANENTGLPSLQSKLSPEEKLKVLRLYQNCPRLWADFRQIVEFIDLFQENCEAYMRLCQQLESILIGDSKHPFVDQIKVIQFAQAVGFAEVCVQLYRQILKAKRLDYVSEYHFPPTDMEMVCAFLLRGVFVGFSYHGPDFRLALAKTGILDNMVEDLKHLQHLTAEALATGVIHYGSLAVIHNCCMSPEALPYVKVTADVVQTLAAFLEKKRNRVRGPSLITLSHILQDPDLDLIQLDPDILQYFLDCAHKAFGITQGDMNCDFGTDAVVYGLWHLARNAFNRRLIVAHGGTMKLLLKVLDKGREDERELAVAAVTELSQDPVNAQLFKRDGDLTRAVRRLQTHEAQKIRVDATVLWSLLQETKPSEDPVQSSPAVAELLEENTNALAILGMGEVEFLLDQLQVDNTAHAQRTTAQPQHTTKHALHALAELARNDNCRREIFARGTK